MKTGVKLNRSFTFIGQSKLAHKRNNVSHGWTIVPGPDSRSNLFLMQDMEKVWVGGGRCPRQDRMKGTRTWLPSWTRENYANMDARMHEHARTHTRTHARTHACTHARTHARIQAHTQTYNNDSAICVQHNQHCILKCFMLCGTSQNSY